MIFLQLRKAVLFMLSYTIIEKRNVLSKKKKKRIILKASVGKPPLETVKISL